MADESNVTLATLVAQAKDRCRITWDDEGTNRRFTNEIVPNAVSVMRFKIGIPASVEFDFTEAGLEHDLIMGYCYYAWHDATDEFYRNYAEDLAHARRIWEVRAFAEQEEAAS